MTDEKKDIAELLELIRQGRKLFQTREDVQRIADSADLTQSPTQSTSGSSVSQASDLGFRWITCDRKTRKAMAIYFEEFMPGIYEQDILRNMIELPRTRQTWDWDYLNLGDLR